MDVTDHLWFLPIGSRYYDYRQLKLLAVIVCRQDVSLLSLDVLELISYVHLFLSLTFDLPNNSLFMVKVKALGLEFLVGLEGCACSPVVTGVLQFATRPVYL